MSFRTVVITQHCKLSYKDNYMIVRGQEITKIHMSEINTLMIDTTQSVITSHLMCELIKNKSKVIFCDEKRNPIGEVMSYYGHHRSSKNIMTQTSWKEETKETIWSRIMMEKIVNQSLVLKRHDKEHWDKLQEYAKEIQIGDITNREGHAAKVYFNALFGKQFTRGVKSSINSALDYGYSILLSSFNKDIVAKGYITQLGIHHRNEYNHFNLSCDLMEPFRPLVDDIIIKTNMGVFDSAYKMKMVDVLNHEVMIDGRKHYVSNAISLFSESVLNALESNDIERMKFVDIGL
ncbi:MAG: type II CRISPR-associated endonuclease Cas1 [Vallitaleaceae bacterium]|nr:type II CRISPR-associated endonuclease Cas1 [Vallitaleaceae bacterium]